MENETVLIDFNNLGEENEREKKIIIHKSKQTEGDGMKMFPIYKCELGGSTKNRLHKFNINASLVRQNWIARWWPTFCQSITTTMHVMPH